MKIQKTSNLVKCGTMTLQECEDGHKKVLHRERICPFCEHIFVAQESMKDCYKEIFGEPTMNASI